MSKEVATTKKNEVAAPLAGLFDTSLQSSGEKLEAADLRIPKMTLIQKMTKSSYNTEGEIVGNYIDSIDKTKLGTDIDIFVMNDTKLWEVKYKQAGDDRSTYLGTIDYTLKNKDLRESPRIPFELEKKAAELKVNADMICEINMINRFYVLKVQDVVDGCAFPYIVDFKRSSYAAGVQLLNSFMKMRKVEKIPSYARAFTLGSESSTNAKGDEFSVKTVSAGRMITPEEIGAVESWVKEMMTNKDAYAEDNSDEEADFVEVEVQQIEESKPKF